ncbi:MAG: hypothetical protein KBC84_10545 [Proteobacteria bacterium]|nr:hypothetical protein [Pseudomonadota bacterium]
MLVLLKPAILTFKNTYFRSGKKHLFNRENISIILFMFIVYSIFKAQSEFLVKLSANRNYDTSISINSIKVLIFSLFSLIFLSTAVISINTLYLSEDTNLLLRSPISNFQIYLSKLIEIAISGSWFFLIILLPVLFAYYRVLELPNTFLISSVLLVFLIILPPTILSIIVISLVVNVIPPHRMRDILVVIFFLVACFLLNFNSSSPEYNPSDPKKVDELLLFFKNLSDPQPTWFPSYWSSGILNSYLTNNFENFYLYWGLIISTTIGSICIGYLFFELLYRRGIVVASQENRSAKIYSPEYLSTFGNIIIPFNSQFRAIAYKEARMFIRDTSQAIQLLMLLILTFVYLYNFKTLKDTSSQFNGMTLVWWKIILSLANISFGCFIVSSIATRFIFPSVSLEGRSFLILLSSPLSIGQIVRYKFYSWLIPICLLTVVLLTSGILAINGPIESIWSTILISISISIGIVGLGIGIGAVYAKFDWDSPSQVIASFGSLVYMMLTFSLLFVCLIPCLLLMVVSTVPEFSKQMSPFNYWFTILGAIILLFAINILTAKKAINAGINSLKER